MSRTKLSPDETMANALEEIEMYASDAITDIENMLGDLRRAKTALHLKRMLIGRRIQRLAGANKK